MRASRFAAALLAGACGQTPPAAAVDLHKSRLSSIELPKCRRISKHPHGGAWICPGLRGYPVYFAEGDLRHMLAFGPTPQRRRSASQTLGQFNSVFQGKRRPTIEWRVETGADGKILPFATIVRFHTSLEGDSGEVLVITKVDAKDSCQLATIDAKVNPDAMAMARSWAIAEARRRSCPDTPEVLGATAKKEK
ncbi:MAG: hypothetical protein ABL907_22210 [Hyphomicrobium sp.]